MPQSLAKVLVHIVYSTKGRPVGALLRCRDRYPGGWPGLA